MSAATILCIGTVGIDEVETPAARVENVLGGSASYFAVAASVVGSQAQLVSVVGTTSRTTTAACLPHGAPTLRGW